MSPPFTTIRLGSRSHAHAKQVKFPVSPSKLAVCKAQADEVEEAGVLKHHGGWLFLKF